MSNSKGILLLLTCLLLLTVMSGVVHANTCTLPPGPIICIATDKTTYSPGDTVYVTVTVTGGNETWYFEVVIMPPSPFGSPIASRLMVLPASVTTDTMGLKLPSNTQAGHYGVGLGDCTSLGLSNGQVVCAEYSVVWSPALTITVTAPTPVPETSSALLLLIPALLVGVYVLRRKKN